MSKQTLTLEFDDPELLVFILTLYTVYNDDPTGDGASVIAKNITSSI